MAVAFTRQVREITPELIKAAFMKRWIAIFILLSAGTTSLASSQRPADVIEVKQSVDAAFFENCLNNLIPYEENTLACVAFKMPADRVFFSDGGFVGSLRSLAHWSELTTACNSARLYVGSSANGDILLITETKECLQVMNDTLSAINYPWTDKVIYLQKKMAHFFRRSQSK